MGEALGKSDEAAQLVEGTKGHRRQGCRVSELAGTSFIYGNRSTTAGADQIYIYTSGDRPAEVPEGTGDRPGADR